MPSRLTLVPWAAKTLVKQLTKPVLETTKHHPQATLAHQDARWWRLSQYDSAVVTNAEGTASSWYKRRPDQTRAMLAESLLLHSKLLAEWGDLKARFREALPRITSVEAWEKTFRDNPPS
jgi:galactofuranosylgalactofuranosylrhamnosyl-N-acetylglucosaminyl-diphospho-decaprenol beta-1,5/1,6-galactofuranosyltransferase